MKYALLAALAVSSVMSGNLLAKDGQSILVESHRDGVAQWAATISRKLDSTLRYPRMLTGQAPPSGIVSVRFQCAEDGRLTNIALARRSGSRALDQAALRAVARINSLHPMPSSVAKDQSIQANLVFALDEDSLDRQLDQLRRESEGRFATARDGNQILALNVGVRNPG